MGKDTPDVSRYRPVLFGQIGDAEPFNPPAGGNNSRVKVRDEDARIARVDYQLNIAMTMLQEQIDLSTSVNAADLQLVLVMEAVEDRTDLVEAARKLNLEVLAEAEYDIDADEDYSLRSSKPRDPFVHSSIHAVCANQASFHKLQTAWNNWKETKQVPGNAKLRDFFSHLRDIRPWSPQDRLKLTGTEEQLAELLPNLRHVIEIELWFRNSESLRKRAQDEVAQLLESAGGKVISVAVIAEIGYHGLSCEVSTELLQKLATGDSENITLIKSPNIMYLRVSGQLTGGDTPPSSAISSATGPVPSGPPVVAILDGVPLANHPLLQNRVHILDPDNFESQYLAHQRKHGTHVTSAIVWGDLSSSEEPLRRPVLVRPIMVPFATQDDSREEVPQGHLTPDLMWRAFRDLFESTGNNTAAAPEVVIVNLSLGDPSTPFDTLLSSWARMLDWLSYHYGVLIIVSAGNHRNLPLPTGDSELIKALNGNERRQATLHAQECDLLGRRLLSPAEAINAITVSATHDDEAGAMVPTGYDVDPTDGLLSLSPVSALGTGYRGSVKPELAAPGGRVGYTDPVQPQKLISFKEAGPNGPGVKVAHSTSPNQTFVTGTSVSAALVTRQAARLHDELDRITGGIKLTRTQRAIAIKALLVHGAQPFADPELNLPLVNKGVGNGVLSRDYSEGCAANEAVVLYLGALKPNTRHHIHLPLPDGLTTTDLKRVSATLAWFSPINWRHRQYRQAKLEFLKPKGDVPSISKPIYVSGEAAKRGATTHQHLVWETQKSFASKPGSELKMQIKCYGQAGLKNDPVAIDYAFALTLWVAPTFGVDVYTQVRDHLKARIRPQL